MTLTSTSPTTAALIPPSMALAAPPTRNASAAWWEPWLDSWCRNSVLAAAAGIRRGELTLVEGGRTHRFGRAAADGLAARIEIRHPAAFRQLVLGGSVGAAEAFLRGEWRSDELTDVIRLFCRNREALASVSGCWSAASQWLRSWQHAWPGNTLDGSRRNIAYHYDLGDNLFSLFLDESMAYSSAVFESPEMSLEAAQIAKFDRICRRLGLEPEHHLLEIGCGWGGLARHAAEQYGCRVTATTISQEQFCYARDLVARSGLTDRVTIVCDDYRELAGQYDRLVSIEMIEAVGHDYLDTYFRSCDRLLRPGGLMLLQAITIADANYREYLVGVDFIQQYVFPGGHLPSLGTLVNSLLRASTFSVDHLENLPQHYARTLRHWRDRFTASEPALRELGLSDESLRFWHYYFAYCEGAFAEHHLGLVQILLTKRVL